MKNYINYTFHYGRKVPYVNVTHSLSRCLTGANTTTYYKSKKGWLKYASMSGKGQPIDEKELPSEVLEAYKRHGLDRLEENNQ
jgi:hypothetical protein